MKSTNESIRVLYSFPNKLGGDRICYTAWQQVNGLSRAGAKLLIMPASTCRPVPLDTVLRQTMAVGKARIPFKLLGNSRSHAVHDAIVARRLRKLAGDVDIVHAWPSGARRTLRVAAELGIPTVLERCNSHTRYGYEVVQGECERLGVTLPRENESSWKEDVLRVEEEEFRTADRLLCPSDFVVRTFVERGFSKDQLARHIYGFDQNKFFPDPNYKKGNSSLRMLFVGHCAVRKGVHYALEAWLRSKAHHNGTFSIAGEFLPEYANRLAPMLSHPSVKVLGHRRDIPELMRNNDVLVLPTLEEGFPLVCTEAMGTGCVPLVSDVCEGICRHGENSLVHRVGDAATLAEHIDAVDRDRDLLDRLRSTALRMNTELTWDQAGVRLLQVYRETIDMHFQRRGPAAPELASRKQALVTSP